MLTIYCIDSKKRTKLSERIEYHYYFLDENMHSLDPNDLNAGPRVFKIKPNIPFPCNENTDGPYNSSRSLKRNSPRWKIYNNLHHKRAQKICEEKWIAELTNQGIVTTSRKGYPHEFMKSVQHATAGSIKKGVLSGVHFYDPNKIKLLEILGINEFGVFKARIQFFNHKTKEWIEKPGTSTFFPMSWSLTQLFHEIAYAYFDFVKEKVEGRDKLFRSRTISGIEIRIVQLEEKVKSIYPIL